MRKQCVQGAPIFRTPGNEARYCSDSPEAKFLVAVLPSRHVQTLLFYQQGVEAEAETLH